MRTLCAVILLTLAGPALAQAPAAPPADPFIGNVSLGYLATSGNTESKNANASMEATWDLDGPWKHDWTALAINARTDGITTAESYTAGYKAQRAFSETSYLFFSGDWRRDRVLGLRQPGLRSHRLRPQAPRHGPPDAGARRRRRRQAVGVDDRRGARRSDRPRRARLRAAHQRASEFNQKLLLEQGDDNRYTESTSALKARIVGNIALVFSVVIKSNSDVPVGIENTDRFASISLEYAF